MNKGQRAGLILILSAMIYCKEGTDFTGLIMLICIGNFVLFGARKHD